MSGNTLPHRQAMRDGGGTWNKLDQCWEFSGEDPTAKLAAAIEAAPKPGHNSRLRRAQARTITAIAAACASAC